MPSKASQHTATALKALMLGLSSHDERPATTHSIAFLSDNGSEFKGAFDTLLQEHGLTHYWTYPKSPKMNAHNERFNRTLQEQFVDYHDDLLFSGDTIKRCGKSEGDVPFLLSFN